MKRVIIATGNLGKVKEFEQLLSPIGYEVLSLKDFPEAVEVPETGVTFEENAMIKARALSEMLGAPVIADDSGLIVDALNGQPGVYSARYAGEPKCDIRNIDKVLTEMRDVPDGERGARFYCAIAYVDGEVSFTVNGAVEGKILYEKVGENGFGYDPIFYALEMGKSMAMCTSEEKNSISHRARALEKVVVKLQGG